LIYPTDSDKNSTKYGKKIEVCETDKSRNQQQKLKQVFPERSRHRSLKYFAEKLQQPEFQAKITGIKHQ
jgi:hypothetical protein